MRVRGAVAGGKPCSLCTRRGAHGLVLLHACPWHMAPAYGVRRCGLSAHEQGEGGRAGVAVPLLPCHDERRISRVWRGAALHPLARAHAPAALR